MAGESLRIIYFTSQGATGTGLVAGLLRQLGHEVPLIVMTPGTERRPSLAYQDVTANPPLPATLLITSKMQQLASLLAGLEPDLILVTGFPRLLPPELLALPRLGAINSHPALLPAYRGPDPLFWQFYNGEPEIGLTIHRMEGEFDTGPILAQGSMPIGPEDTPEDVYPRFFEIAPALMTTALAKVIAGDPGEPQDPAHATYAPLTTVADRTVDWTRTATQIRNQTRACYGSGALAMVGGEERMIHRARLAPAIQTSGINPGEIILVTESGTVMQTGDGALLVSDMGPVAGAEG
ncbi:MAG TPA: formyltransferase family protein [Ktedonobacterales bacterium]